MVAGLVAGLATHQDAAQALRLGLVMGAGTAAKPGTGLATREDLDALLPMTEIKEMAS
jgi:fructose-1-phosphate kinase PfkB-like protein